MKESKAQEHFRRIGKRMNARALLGSKVSVSLTLAVEAELHAQARAMGKSPEAYAAHLIVQGIHIHSLIKDLEQPLPSIHPSTGRPAGLRQIVLGTVSSRAPHHARLIRDLLDGGVLIERRAQVFELLINGESRNVNPSMVSSLLAKGVLWDADS